MKKVVLRNFSDIATPMEAAQKLRNMKMTSDQPIASYNYNYAAVHEAAFDINPSEQRMRFALENYANSLPEYTSDKLSYKNSEGRLLDQNPSRCHGPCSQN